MRRRAGASRRPCRRRYHATGCGDIARGRCDRCVATEVPGLIKAPLVSPAEWMFSSRLPPAIVYSNMPESTYRNRRAHSIETADLRVTVLVEGGHIAEIADKGSGVNPLWTPPWPSIEPSTYDRAKHQYGADAESKLLSGIMGHNLCLDLFGGPSEAEAAAGLTVHGEGAVAGDEITAD